MPGNTVALTGNDTISINNRVLNDLALGDFAMITYGQPVANIKTGKNNNAIMADNKTGQQAKVEVYVIRGSADDKYLNNLLQQQLSSFQSKVLDFGEYIKNIGDGQGNVTKDMCVLSAGVMVQNVDGKSNAEGDTNQGVAKYTFEFATAVRTLT